MSLAVKMTTDRANSLVVTSLAVTSALVVIRQADAGTVPPARFIVGVCLAGAGLGVVAQLAPSVAGGLALLMLTTGVLVYGGPAFDAIDNALGDPSATAKTPAPSAPSTRKGFAT